LFGTAQKIEDSSKFALIFALSLIITDNFCYIKIKNLKPSRQQADILYLYWLRGVQNLQGESLEAVWAEFSTLS
jgi:hypothetical protein